MSQLEVREPLFPNNTMVKLVLRTPNRTFKYENLANPEIARHDGKKALVIYAAYRGIGNRPAYKLLVLPDEVEIAGILEDCLLPSS